jgi:hypothetical protein
VVCCAWDATGRVLAAGSESGSVYVLNGRDLRVLQVWAIPAA